MQYAAYALPAVAALLAKAGIFFYARHSAVDNVQTRLYLLFLFCLSIQNLAEIQLFITNAGSLTNPPQFIGTLYFSTSIAAVALLLHLSLLIARDSERDRNRDGLTGASLVILYAPALVLEIVLWTSPLVVAGFEPTGYSYSKIPGPLYPLFQGYAIAYLFAAPVVLYYGYRNQTTPFRRLQNKLFLVGLLPIPLLVGSVIVLQELGFRAINSTATLPLAVTFFLVVTAYATHQYRLFDIEFFLPWSKIRKRKTAFYRRIQATIAAIAELKSARQIMRLLADTLHCEVALVGGARTVAAGHEASDGEHVAIAEFPPSAMREINQITVAQEIADKKPDMHQLMKRYRVAAVVPFVIKDTAATQWLVLGERFSDNVYTPLDFKVVERLFSAIAERFLDGFLRVRSELREVEQRLRNTRRKLGLAWHREHELREQLRALRNENDALRQELTVLRRKQLRAGTANLPLALQAGPTLNEYLSDCEKQSVASAMKTCRGSKRDAALLLGVTVQFLERLMQRHGVEGPLDADE